MRGCMLRDNGWADETELAYRCLSTWTSRIGLLFRGYQVGERLAVPDAG